PFRTARVGNDTAVAKRPRTPFGAALKPAENFSIGDDPGGAAGKFFFAQLRDGIAAFCQPVCINFAADFLASISRSPVGMLHHERTRLAEFLMPDVVRGADCQASISCRRMNINLLERGCVKYFSVRDAIESHAAC